MRPNTSHVGLVVALVVVSTAVVGVVAGNAGAVQESDEAGESDELLSVSGWAAVAAFLLGSLILLGSVEVLIHALVRTASRFGVSALLLAVVVSGTEVDNVAFGVFTGFREMQNVAFGLAIGNAISIFGLTLAAAALLYPFDVDVPTDYLAIMVVSPLVLLPYLLTGRIDAVDGVVLIAAYLAVFGYIAARELRGDRSYMRSGEVMEAATSADGQGEAAAAVAGDGVTDDDLPGPLRRVARRDWFWPAVMLVALGGIVVGAETASTGTEGIVETWDLHQTAFGVTMVTIVFTLDDLLLAVEPVRLGYNDIAVGGVIGSLLFFVTANTGIVALVGSVTTSPRALYFHLPALLVIAGLSGLLLWRGKLTRLAGAALLGLYVAYLAMNVFFFSALPVSG
ncbi:sodium:calcium antiporter [Halorussus rarus]|uniref:sodium:calcium antiporter n=1 Tax=Halorussus rarus TaxID=660515 RepID=UPI0013B3CF7F|nr:sodium:proton exchanger [Halorussus rarus]